MTARDLLEQSRLAKVAADLQARGFEVFIDPAPGRFELPDFVRPDLVAVRNDERVAVEVKVPQGLADPQLARMAEVLNELAGWRFEVVVVNPIADQPSAPPATSIQAPLVEKRAEEALALMEDGHAEAALLVAWSALEGALRLREERKGTPQPHARPAGIKELYSLGLLTASQYELLEHAGRQRSRIAHGYAVAESEDLAPTVERVASLARKAADPDYPTIEEMVEWFFDHYEDPAQGVPHDSGEGGYQYILGGPYGAREELQEQFPNVDLEDIDEAASQIEAEGYEWVKKGEY